MCPITAGHGSFLPLSKDTVYKWREDVTGVSECQADSAWMLWIERDEVGSVGGDYLDFRGGESAAQFFRVLTYGKILGIHKMRYIYWRVCPEQLELSCRAVALGG